MGISELAPVSDVNWGVAIAFPCHTKEVLMHGRWNVSACCCVTLLAGCGLGMALLGVSAAATLPTRVAAASAMPTPQQQ